MRLKLSQVAEVTLGRQRAPQYEEGDNLVPYLRSANITDGALDLSDVKQMNFTPGEQQWFRLRPGDVLVTEGSGSRDTVGASAVWLGEMDGVVCFQNTLLRIRPRAGVTDGRYLAWWARHAHASRQIAAVASGANILHLGAEGLRGLEIDVPPLDEQRRIADFLDDQVTRIDNVIAASEGQIGQAKTLTAAQAVSRLLGGGSLDGDAQSAWYRALPGSFAVLPLRAVWRVVDCKHRTPEYVGGGYPVVSPGDVEPGRLDLSVCTRFVGEDDYRDLADDLRRCRRGDIVYSRNASAGIAAYVDTDEPFTMGQDVCRITSKEASQHYLFHALNFLVRPQLDWVRVGATFTRINIEEIRRLRVPIPSPADQREIAVAVDDIIEQGERAVAAIGSRIALLTEYKQSLITAAVTGEIDVTTSSGRALSA